jgi:hypothetical protein
MTKTIPLTRGAVTLVDDDDYDLLISIGKWHLSDTGYAVNRSRFNGKKKTIRMHRVVNKTPKHLVTDHINRNPLDNRKSNLRSVTQKENMSNIDHGLGVWYQKQNSNWVVEIYGQHVGCFKEFELAYQIAQMIYSEELPLTRIKEYNPYCKRGHNKELVGTYRTTCRICVLDKQKAYYIRKRDYEHTSRRN